MKMVLIALAALLAVPVAGYAQHVTDPQIAAIVVTANQVDIDAGKLAVAQGSSDEVKRFGQSMIDAHTAVNKQAVDLVTRLKVTPEDNATSQSLKAGGEASIQRLKTLKDGDFDRAYVEREIAYHQQVLDAIDKTLIPSAQNSDLKALLTKVRPAIAAHLDHAKSIQTKMKR
jgi:putative membrane protein